MSLRDVYERTFDEENGKTTNADECPECTGTLIHRAKEEAQKLAEWFGLSERESNWVRTAKAGNDEDGYSEAPIGPDEEGWFPLRVRASGYEADVITGRSSTATSETESENATEQREARPAGSAQAYTESSRTD